MRHTRGSGLPPHWGSSCSCLCSAQLINNHRSHPGAAFTVISAHIDKVVDHRPSRAGRYEDDEVSEVWWSTVIKEELFHLLKGEKGAGARGRDGAAEATPKKSEHAGSCGPLHTMVLISGEPRHENVDGASSVCLVDWELHREGKDLPAPINKQALSRLPLGSGNRNITKGSSAANQQTRITLVVSSCFAVRGTTFHVHIHQRYSPPIYNRSSQRSYITTSSR
ncbi:unnamed protein product, partial [Pleuronectes platessa]